jgi:hypothetical protein
LLHVDMIAHNNVMDLPAELVLMCKVMMCNGRSGK